MSFIKWITGAAARERQEQLNATLSEMQSNINDLRTQATTARAELETANAELTVFRAKAAEHEARQTSKEPWVEIKSDAIDDVKGIQIELDWNPAFVMYLRENGISAKEDEAVVQKWLALLYKDLTERLEDQHIEEGLDPHDSFE